MHLNRAVQLNGRTVFHIQSSRGSSSYYTLVVQCTKNMFECFALANHVTEGRHPAHQIHLWLLRRRPRRRIDASPGVPRVQVRWLRITDQASWGKPHVIASTLREENIFPRYNVLRVESSDKVQPCRLHLPDLLPRTLGFHPLELRSIRCPDNGGVTFRY